MSDSAGRTPPDRRWSPGRIASVAFPVLVWFIGSFFLLGDLGKWLDDYAAHVRDPVSGSFAWGDVLSYPWWFFWRPLHVQLVFTLQTLLWNHDWLNHLFSALMHALACWSMWLFLRTCGVRSLVAASAAVIMLSAPQGFEAIFWPATVSTSIAAAAYFWAGRIVVRFAQDRHRPVAIPALAALGFAIPCLYEQPAAALGALPLLYLAAMAPGGSARTIPKHVARLVLALAPCGLAVIAYVLAYILTVRRDPMARESQFIDASALWPRADYTLRTMLNSLRPLHELAEARTLGWDRLTGGPFIGVALLLACTILGLLWLVRSVRTDPVHAARASTDSSPRVRPLGLALFALAGMLLAIVPIMLIGGAGVTPRLTYFPLACTLVACAALAELVLTWFSRQWGSAAVHRTLLVTLGSASLVLAGIGIVTLVGLQVMYQRRHAADMRQLTNLAAAVPTPEPGTVFVPIGVEPDAATPAAPRLRNSFQSIWQSPWAVNTMIKHAYRRRDVHATCIYMHNQSNAIMRLGDPTLITWSHYMWKLPTPRMIEDFPPFTQRQVLPFEVRADNEVVLVRSIATRSLDGDERTFTFPQSASAPLDRAFPVPVQTGNEWIYGWRWSSKPLQGDGQYPIVKFPRIASWGANARAVRMHPRTASPIEDGDTDAMQVVLPPSPKPRSVIFHATFPEATIEQSLQGDGVELACTLNADARTTIRWRVEPQAVKAARAWIRHEVPVPPSDQPITLRIECLAGPANNPHFDRVIVSCGEIATPAPPSN